MHRNRSVSAHQFAMVPRADIPRSSFKIQRSYRSTFDSGYLIPVLCEEVLPGDSFRLKMTAFARLATPIFPIMDNLHLDTFFFFVPNRLVWTNWVKFMGEQDNPADSISYVVPKVTTGVGGWPVNSLGDFFGLPTVGQVGAGATVTHNVLPLRAYNLIYNEWFRDENLQNRATLQVNDGPDTLGWYTLRRRGKRHDYFTSCLPWPQKGNTSVSIPLGTTAPVITGAVHNTTGGVGMSFIQSGGGAVPNSRELATGVAGGFGTTGTVVVGTGALLPSNLYADLSQASAATINQLRQSFQIQKLLERDARGGTRYTELVRAHFGVVSPDARLQRPEYLGGGSTPILVQPVQQTSETATTPLGSLGGFATGLASGHGFSQSFTEHGYVIGLVSVRADLSYSQGMRKMWSRDTRYDFYFPAFAHLGEQAVLNKEIFLDGSATDDQVFGYQERWAEYRYSPSQVTGLFRPQSAGNISAWHLSQDFSTVPVLGSTFISESPPLDRVLAVGAAANGQQILFDSFFEITAARPMPLYSVPGLLDHF